MQTFTDNFNSNVYVPNRYVEFDSRKTNAKNEKDTVDNGIVITLRDYMLKNKNNTFFSFFKDEEKIGLKNQDDLIISIKKDGENYLAQTGNYVGKFVWQGLKIDIKSRFTNTFLERMLNFANDLFLDDISITGDKTDKNLDMSKYIIYYMFVQNLEKVFLLGLPKAYTNLDHHEMKLKGKINIHRFIKYDIPFQGKVSSTSREQKEIQEIIDTLYKAIKIIDKKHRTFTKNILHVKTHLKQHRSNNYVSNETINKALKSKALVNPIFSPYKKVLEYAQFIINGNNLEENSKGEYQTYGFLVNVAELFEIYVSKVLKKEFSDWSVKSPKIELYPNNFYARKIIPDIVMQNGNNLLVFDTKYKRMLMRNRYQNGGDVDRNDFFQINTYMSYYQNHQDKYNVVAGGLLYPMEKEFDKSTCHSDSWFGNDKTKFIIDGIDLSKGDSKELILDAEEAFIERIRGLIKRN